MRKIQYCLTLWLSYEPPQHEKKMRVFTQFNNHLILNKFEQKSWNYQNKPQYQICD